MTIIEMCIFENIQRYKRLQRMNDNLIYKEKILNWMIFQKVLIFVVFWSWEMLLNIDIITKFV